MDAQDLRVRILLGDRELFSSTLANLGPTSSGQNVKLAVDSSKTQSPLPAFERLGWSFCLYGMPPKVRDTGPAVKRDATPTE